MATDLTNVAVSTGYVQLLHIDGGVGGSVNRVYDGDGTGAPLQLSTTVVEILDGANYLDVASHDGTYGLKLGGTLVTSSATELNYNDITTLGTAQASKVLTTDANIDVTGIRNLTATGTITAANFTGSGNTTIGDAADDTVAINSTITTDLIFEGATANDFELTLTPGDPTADRTLTLPDATDTLVGKTTTDTLTNKTLTSPVLNTADINTPDIDGGTVDAITSLTVANNVDIGNHTLTSNGLTIDGTFTDGTLSIASGSISSAVSGTFSGTVSFGTLTDSGESISITKFVDELDGISANDNDTTVPTSAAVKDYVDTTVTGEDLDVTTDSGTIAIDLDSETLTLAGGTGVDTSAATNTVTFDLDLNELTTETTIADADFIAMVDATDSGSGKITFENLEDAIFASVSGDILITEAGVATIQANSVALATDTTGDFVSTITAGTGLTSTGATSGENIAHSLSVDASQTQITAVGALDAGSITSNFGSIDIGSSNFTTTGTVSTGALTATANLDIGAFTLRASNFLADSQTSGQVAFYGTDGVLSGDTDLTFSGSTLTVTDLTVSGTLSTTGAVQEISTTNLNVEDPLILLNKYDSQPAANVYDAGFVIKRGSTDTAPANVAFIWDESENTFSLVDTTEDGTTAGNVTITDYEDLRVGALTADDASTFTSTISTASGSTIGNLTLADGSITDSSGAISFGDENLSTTGTLSAGQITGTSFVIGAADIGEAELEILDGATVTTTELNIMDGDTAASATTVVDADRVVMNDAGVMKQVAVTDLSAYFDDEITAMPNLVSTGALNSGSITSGFGNIDNGSSTITTTGTVSTGALTVGGNIDFNSGTIDLSTQTVDVTLNAAVDALNFDSNTLSIDASNNRVGIGTASPSRLLDLETTNASGSTLMSLVSAIDGNCQLLFGDTSSDTQGKILYNNDGDYMAFTANGSERMRIDSSGNVGIGETSPSTSLHVKRTSGGAGIKVESTATSGEGTLTVAGKNSGGTARSMIVKYDNSDVFRIGTADAVDMRFETSDTERVRIDSRGAVGFGTTPTTDTHTGWNHIFIGEKGSLISENDTGVHGLDGMFITDNMYVDKDTGAFAYIATNESSAYRQEAGIHQWFSQASGTAGAAVTLSEKMRIDSSGNVRIGEEGTAFATSPDTRLHVTTAQLTGDSDNTVYEIFKVSNRSAGSLKGSNFGIGLSRWQATGNNYPRTRVDFKTTGLTDDSDTLSTTVMSLRDDGRIGIGTTAPSYKLDVEESGSGVFPASFVHSDGTTPRGLRITFSGGNSFGNTDDYAIFFEDDTAAHFYVAGDGSVQNVSGTYGSALSDERLKENIVDATGKLDDLLKLKVKNFTFKNDSTETKHIGFIAQEFEQVFPSLVTERDDSEHSGITDLKGLQVGMEFAILVKAIQELSAQNDALTARIEALENA